MLNLYWVINMNESNTSKRNENEASVNEQQALLDAIWHDAANASHGFDARGISIYRRNLLANAQRALSISFPTVFMLLDSDVSMALTKSFLHSSPPVQGDWAQWGDEFADFIADTAVGRDYPYLADSAALDWHVHCALHGNDQTLEQASLQLLANCDPENIAVEFNDNVQLFISQYPIAEIFTAHHAEDSDVRDTALANAQQALVLSTLTTNCVMVYRPEFQPQVKALTASEADFVSALTSGKSLATALDNVSGNSDFSFETWLVSAIQTNLIQRFKEL